MNRIPFVLKMVGENRENLIQQIETMKDHLFEICANKDVSNFSVWQMEQYLFAYGESENDCTDCFEEFFESLPEDITVACKPGSMRLMYHDIGIVRQDKSLIRHRVFATKLKPGCAEEYKRRHDALIEARGDSVKEGPESNFTIWFGDGHIFGYCELVRSFDAIQPTEEEREAGRQWEIRQLEIMDWLTDDVNWITGENHPPVRRVI